MSAHQTPPPPDLPRDGDRILALAARSMFDLFANASEGMLLIDRDARVVWINDQYRRFLPALGFAREEDFVGQPVAQVIDNTQMHEVLRTGMDFRLRCLGCGHELMLPRSKAEKNIRQILRGGKPVAIK